jgi:hypothetical protein
LELAPPEMLEDAGPSEEAVDGEDGAMADADGSGDPAGYEDAELSAPLQYPN